MSLMLLLKQVVKAHTRSMNAAVPDKSTEALGINQVNPLSKPRDHWRKLGYRRVLRLSNDAKLIYPGTTCAESRRDHSDDPLVSSLPIKDWARIRCKPGEGKSR